MSDCLIRLKKIVAGMSAKTWRVETSTQHGASVWGPCGVTGSMSIGRIGHAAFDMNNALGIAALRNCAPALLDFVEAFSAWKKFDWDTPYREDGEFDIDEIGREAERLRLACVAASDALEKKLEGV